MVPMERFSNREPIVSYNHRTDPFAACRVCVVFSYQHRYGLVAYSSKARRSLVIDSPQTRRILVADSSLCDLQTNARFGKNWGVLSVITSTFGGAVDGMNFKDKSLKKKGFVM